jgi:low temperature requirement protein LtrA
MPLCLGESVLAVVVGTDLAEFSLTASLTAGVCFAIATALWWVYFDFAETSVVSGDAGLFIYVYGHLALYAGLAAFGAGAELAIEAAGDDGLDPGTRWALCGGLGLYLLCLAVFHGGVRTRLRDSIVALRLGGVGAFVALAAFGGGLAPLALAGIALAIALTELAVEATYTRVDCAAPVSESQVAMRSEDQPAEQLAGSGP